MITELYSKFRELIKRPIPEEKKNTLLNIELEVYKDAALILMGVTLFRILASAITQNVQEAPQAVRDAAYGFITLGGMRLFTRKTKAVV